MLLPLHSICAMLFSSKLPYLTLLGGVGALTGPRFLLPPEPLKSEADCGILLRVVTNPMTLVSVRPRVPTERPDSLLCAAGTACLLAGAGRSNRVRLPKQTHDQTGPRRPCQLQCPTIWKVASDVGRSSVREGYGVADLREARSRRDVSDENRAPASVCLLFLELVRAASPTDCILAFDKGRIAHHLTSMPSNSSQVRTAN